jgi:hypothetical protein
VFLKNGCNDLIGFFSIFVKQEKNILELDLKAKLQHKLSVTGYEVKVR